LGRSRYARPQFRIRPALGVDRARGRKHVPLSGLRRRASIRIGVAHRLRNLRSECGRGALSRRWLGGPTRRSSGASFGVRGARGGHSRKSSGCGSRHGRRAGGGGVSGRLVEPDPPAPLRASHPASRVVSGEGPSHRVPGTARVARPNSPLRPYLRAAAVEWLGYCRFDRGAHRLRSQNRCANLPEAAQTGTGPLARIERQTL
jgi:hypothetical protein